MRDIYSSVQFVQALAPQTINTVAKTSGDIDLQGFDSVVINTLIGDITETLSGSAKIDLKIEHADDNGAGAAGAYTACVDTDVIGFTGLVAGLFKSIQANAAELKNYPIGYVGGKRFIKLTATPTGLTTGGAMAITAVKGHPSQAPVAQTV